VRLWDYAGGREVGRLVGHGGAVRRVMFLPGGDHALSCADDGAVRLWDLRRAAPPLSPPVQPGPEVAGDMRRIARLGAPASGLACSPDGRQALAAAGAELRLYDLKSGKPIRFFRGHKAAIFGLAVSRDWRRALTGSPDGTVRVWDVEEGKELKCFDDFDAWVFGVALSPDGTKALAGFGGLQLKNGELVVKDGRHLPAQSGVRLWEIESGKQLHVFKTNPSRIDTVAFSPDGRRVLYSTGDQNLYAWDVLDKKSLPPLTGLGYGPIRIAWDPDGRHGLLGGPGTQLRLYDLEERKRVREFTGHTGHVNAVAVSADGKLAVSGAGVLQPRKGRPPRLQDSTLRVWDFESGRQKAVFKAAAKITSVAISPDRKFALCGDEKGNLLRCDLPEKVGKDAQAGVEKQRFKGLGFIDGVSIAPDGRRVLVAGGTELRLFDLKAGPEPKVLRGHQNRILHLSVSRDWKRALTGGMDGTVRLWDLDKGKELKSFDCEALVGGVAISPDGRYGLARAGGYAIKDGKAVVEGRVMVQAEGTVRLWDLGGGKEIKRWTFPKGNTIATVSFTPDGRHALYGFAGKLHRWDLRKKKELETVPGMPPWEFGMTWAPDRRHALVFGIDKQVRLWDAQTGKFVRDFVGHEAQVRGAAISADGTRVVTGGGYVFHEKDKPPVKKDCTLRVWDYASGKELAVYAMPEPINCLALSPDKKFAFTGGFAGNLIQWDLTGKGEAEAPDSEAKPEAAWAPLALKLRPWCLSLSKDGRYAAVCDNEIAVFDLRKRQEVRRWLSPKGYTRCVAFAPDGKHLFGGGKDGKLFRWDFATGEEVTVYKGHTDWITAVAVSPDGKLVATGSGDLTVVPKDPHDFTVRLWDVASGKQRFRLVGHKQTLRGLCFSANGRRLLSVCADRSLIVWDVRSGKPVQVVKLPEAPRTPQQAGLSCSADGRRVLFSTGSTFQVWDLKLGRLLRVESPEGEFANAVFCDKGRRVLTGTTGWLRRGGQFVRENGRMVLPACVVRLWDLKTGKEVKQFEGHTDQVVQVVCSPDGTHVYSVAGDRTLRRWELPKK
jgi:WD40 repeat protein